jgi:autotransporter-associated beta strand protein
LGSGTLTVGDASSRTFAGEISGSGGVVKTGSGSWILTASNTYSGGTVISNGTLLVGNNAAVGTGALTINSGTFASDSSTSRTITNAVTIGGNVQLGDATGTGALTLSNINLGTATRVLTVSNTTTVAGAITNTGGLTKAGNGTLTLAASNTYSGGTTISAGALLFTNGGSVLGAITNNAALVFNRSDDLIQSAVISGSGSLSKSGNGTLTLSGASANTYSGLTSINAGTLNLNKSAGTEAIAGNITLSASGATLLLSASGQVADASIVTLSGGTIRRGGNVSEVFGNLNVSAPSFLDFGAGNAAGTLSFGTYTQSALLTVQNFLPGNKLQFASGFNEALLPTGGNLSNANFSFSNGFTTGTEGGYFTITAIPEPSTVWCALGLFALFGTSSWLRWQRRTLCAAPRKNSRS